MTNIFRTKMIKHSIYPLLNSTFILNHYKLNKKSLLTTSTSSKEQQNESKQTEFQRKDEILKLSQLKPTIRTFLTDTYLFQHNGNIIYCGDDEKYGEFIICDDTIFHPQGGGQPEDKGNIQNMDGSTIFNVEFVADHPHFGIHGFVCHFGKYSNKNSTKSFQVGEKVEQNINKEDREMFARLHSGAHIIDIGMNTIGKKLEVGFFEPTKAFCVPPKPYIEFAGHIPIDKRSDFKQELQNFLNGFITNNQSLKTVTKIMECDKHLKELVWITDDQKKEEYMEIMNLKKDSMIRVISFPGFGEGICGGTHIDVVNRIKHINVAKLKTSRKRFRVSYKVE